MEKAQDHVEPGRVKGTSIDQIATLKMRAVFRAFLKQSPAMWLIQLYVFFEYVRPQTVYPQIAFLPWSLITLALAVVACIVEGRFHFTARTIWAPVFALTAVVIASSLAAYSPRYSYENANVWLNWVLLMFIIGAGIRNKKELLLLLLAFGVWNIKMTQHGVISWASIGFSFRAIGVGGAPGWFQNSGEFGIQMCVFFPLVAYFAYGTWPRLGSWARVFVSIVMASAIVSMIATSSRGALVGAAAIAAWAIWRSPHRIRVMTMAAIVSAVVWLAVPAESKDRFREMGDDKSSTTRLTYWKDGIRIANQNPVLGIGYKNWIPYYTTYYNPNGQLPHNFLVEAVAELGYIGLMVLIWLIVSSFRATAYVRRSTGLSSPNPDRLLFSLAYGLDGALIGFMVSGSFVSVLYYPYLWMNTAMVAALVSVVKRERALRAVSPRRSARLQLSPAA